LQVLGDQSKLHEASVQLANKAKKASLDLIIRACVIAMTGLLNIYTNQDLEYSWRRASEIVAKMQKCETNHAQCICK